LLGVALFKGTRPDLENWTIISLIGVAGVFLGALGRNIKSR
jgi:hypothetical protein